MVSPSRLYIAVDAASSHNAWIDRCLRHSATGLAELCDRSALGCDVIVGGTANVGNRRQAVHEVMHLVEQIVGRFDRLQIIELAGTQLAIEMTCSVG